MQVCLKSKRCLTKPDINLLNRHFLEVKTHASYVFFVVIFILFTRLAESRSGKFYALKYLKLKTVILNDERLVLVIDVSKGNSVWRHGRSSLARNSSLDGTEQRLLWPEVQLRLFVFFLVFTAASAIM